MKNKLLETNSLKLNDIIVLGQKYLLNHHIVNAKKEIEWFLIDRFKLNISEIKLNSNKSLSKIEKNQFIDFLYEWASQGLYLSFWPLKSLHFRQGL